VPANCRRGRPQGQCHRKQTARAPTIGLRRSTGRPAGKGETVRQKRTAPLATGAAGQTPPGARPNRGGRRHGTKTHFVPMAAEAFPPRRPGWSREACREARPRGMAVSCDPGKPGWHGQNPAYRPSGAITPPGVVSSSTDLSTAGRLDGCACYAPTTLPHRDPAHPPITRTKQKHNTCPKGPADSEPLNRRQVVELRLKFRPNWQVKRLIPFDGP